MIEYKAEQAATYLLEQAVNLVEALLDDHAFDLKGVLDHARQLVADWEPGPTTRAIMDAAERRGIPYRRDGTGSRLQLGYGKNLRYVQAGSTDRTSMIAVELKEDRDLRGRAPGEVSDLVRNTVREVSPALECHVVLDEVDALRHAVSQMIKGEVIVLFYEKLKPVQSLLDEFAAQPVHVLPQIEPLQAPPKVQPGFKRSFPTRFAPRRIDRGLNPCSL